MSRRSRPQYRPGLEWILGVAFPDTLTRPVRLAQGFTFVRCCGSPRASSPHGLTAPAPASLRRRILRAVASGSRLLPPRPAKDFHLQSSAHARHTWSGYALPPSPQQRRILILIVAPQTLDPRPRDGGGDAAAPSRLSRRRRADHSSRLSERQTLRQTRAGGRDRGRLRLRPYVARCTRRGDRKPRRGGAGRELGDGAAAGKNHADATRHRQDDRHRHRGGGSGRLGRLSPALCDALRPLRAQSSAV